MGCDEVDEWCGCIRAVDAINGAREMLSVIEGFKPKSVAIGIINKDDRIAMRKLVDECEYNFVTILPED